MPHSIFNAMGDQNNQALLSPNAGYGQNVSGNPAAAAFGRLPTPRLVVRVRHAVLITVVALLAGCQTPQPMPTVPTVDIERFMGDWYVIANIPTFVEKGAHNAVETYSMNTDGTIATRFTFRQDGFDGELKEYNPKGFVRDRTSNAVWGMQFIWPFKAEYRIIYLTEDYSQTVIGRSKRDYVWVMARTPSIPEEDYAMILELLTRVGYDVGQLQMVPQQPEAER